MRAIRKDDHDNALIGEVGKRGGLKSLGALFLAVERSEPSIARAYQDLLSEYAAAGALVIDNWWSSESGSPISGVALDSSVAVVGSNIAAISPLHTKPGSAGLPMPGFDVRIVDDDGEYRPGLNSTISYSSYACMLLMYYAEERNNHSTSGLVVRLHGLVGHDVGLI